MSKYITENGAVVASDSPDRAIWYGQCGYWTDDWDKPMKLGPGIPCCPKCKTPGFIGIASQWFQGAEKLDEKEPGYLKFLNDNKEKCYRHYPQGFMSAWLMTQDMLKIKKQEEDKK